MPRLPSSLLRRASSISPHLATLLPTCRDLRSAQNELRWIRQHAASVVSTRRVPRAISAKVQNVLTAQLCARRGRGVPLQYVLGTQPFGALDIRCRPGVLIPRAETEAYVVHLAGLIRGGESGVSKDGHGHLRIADFCSGTGCIGLLLYALLRPHFPRVSVRGFDVSDTAVKLARENLKYNVRHGLLPGTAQEEVVFEKADIFSDDWLSHIREGNKEGAVDILISNPPYISTAGFNHGTSRSVRNHEPKMALVPDARRLGVTADALKCAPEDVFYARLLDVAETVRPFMMVIEVGGLDQAARVAGLAASRGSTDQRVTQVWRDWPYLAPEEDDVTEVNLVGRLVAIKGSGHGRAVVIHRRS